MKPTWGSAKCVVFACACAGSALCVGDAALAAGTTTEVVWVSLVLAE